MNHIPNPLEGHFSDADLATIADALREAATKTLGRDRAILETAATLVAPSA